MTRMFLHVIVSIRKIGSQVRKGMAMLQIHTNNFKNLYRPYDLKGTRMLSADKAEKLSLTCHKMDGSSGYLGPGVSLYILE